MANFPIPAPAFDGSSQTVPAGNAFEWFRQGWVVLAAHPGPWVILTVVLLIIALALNIVPLVGSLAWHLVTPVFAAGLLGACRKSSNGIAPELSDLFSGFKQGSTGLILLGIAYMAGMLTILAVGMLIGGGSLAGGLMSTHPTGIGLAFGGLFVAMLLSLALSVPLLMALWFAPALVYFNQMSPLAALRASFDACLKNALAFIVFGLMALVLLFFAALPLFLGFLVLIPILTGAAYASYRDIFVAD